jgi:bifunctional ADP-heptose synthase (sugar kinase/adenylyltransferase)
MKEAVRLANRAAGIVVGKFGTAVVTPEELFGKDEGGRRKDE